MNNSDANNLIEEETERLFIHSVSYWEELRNASIFMTGATGLFGRWILPAMLHANAVLGLNLKVCVLSRNVAAFKRSLSSLQTAACVEFVEGNVKNFEFPSQHFDYVIHGATTSAHETFNGETSLEKFNTLVDGTRRVLEFARIAKPRRILFLSSGVVYGALLEEMTAIPEYFQGAPDTSDHRTGLGQAKRASEYLCAEYAHLFGFEATIARCFSFAGPLLPTDLHYAFGNFIYQALHGDKIVVQGDGSPIRSYLYLGDLVHWLLPLLILPHQHTIYNIGSDHALSIRELAHQVKAIVAPAKDVEILGRASYSIGNTPRNIYVPDVSRIQEEFGVNVKTSLHSIIELTARYERLHADGRC